jgi:hypothetical protein
MSAWKRLMLLAVLTCGALWLASSDQTAEAGWGWYGRPAVVYYGGYPAYYPPYYSYYPGYYPGYSAYYPTYPTYYYGSGYPVYYGSYYPTYGVYYGGYYGW